MVEEFKKEYLDYEFSLDDFMLGIDPIGDFISHKECENDIELTFRNSHEFDMYYEEISDRYYEQRQNFIHWLNQSYVFSPSDKDFYTVYTFEWSYSITFDISKYIIYKYPGYYIAGTYYPIFLIFDKIDGFLKYSGMSDAVRNAAAEREMDDLINENFYPFIEDSPEWFDENKDIWLNKMSA
jgi:hypothetical protein